MSVTIDARVRVLPLICTEATDRKSKTFVVDLLMAADEEAISNSNFIGVVKNLSG